MKIVAKEKGASEVGPSSQESGNIRGKGMEPARHFPPRSHADARAPRVPDAFLSLAACLCPQPLDTPLRGSLSLKLSIRLERRDLSTDGHPRSAKHWPARFYRCDLTNSLENSRDGSVPILMEEGTEV